jgi:putative heme-binding domain-containing protein
MTRTLLALSFALVTATAPATGLPLHKGDHICLIGNTLADRMQHHGWLETLFVSHLPRHDLVFRDLGFSGDELTVRLRSFAFGSPESWLTKCKADVVFAFFGYNESYGGQAGLAKFQKDLDSFVKLTLAQKYNGRSAPRLVLFSPLAHENLHDCNLPDGSANNARLQLYTAAMAEVARQNEVPFVDLFTASQELYARAARPLTINGIHLSEQGDRLIAKVIEKALLGEVEGPRDPAALEKLRQAVLDKNLHWFNRYRTVDGYSIYGGRADLHFKPDNQSNREVMQREMEELDVMTANRDKRIWAVAQGRDLKVDDSNAPPFIPVKTNIPGPLPEGKHVFLGGEEAIQKMTLAKNLKVTLFASEEMFPELAKPVQMAFDTKGRLWVAAWPTYPHWKPGEPMNDKLLILEDTKGTGKADKCTVFADNLHCPTGFEFYKDGVLVAQAPDLMFLRDTKGTGKADWRERVLHGLDSADTHHTANSFARDPGGAIYFQEGTFHHTQVETPYGPPQRCANAGVYRYEPRTQKFDVYVTYPFANPHGHAFDRWGQDIVVDGTGSQPYHAALFSGHLDFPNKHNGPPQVYQQWTRPCPGIEVLSSRHFPAAMQGNLLVANVIGYHGILQYKIEDKGASFAGTEAERLLVSSDPNFRPSDIKIGPDGAIWFIDWHNPIIGHMQHNLRDPNRDRSHGRIYRITYEGRPLSQSPKIAGEPIPKLLDVLKHPEARVRHRARLELEGRKTEDVIAATRAWIDGLDKNARDYEHHLLEALWLYQSHNVVNEDLLHRMLGSTDYRARAAATRVLCYWRDRIPHSLDLLKKSADDLHPRVRLEAVRAASFFPVPEAVEVPLIAGEHPSDPYLDYTQRETMRTLDPIWKAALAEAKTIPVTHPAAARFFLRGMALEQLLRQERTRAVNLELLFRPGLRDELRTEALRGLARADGTLQPRVLLNAVALIDQKKETREDSVLFDLVRLLSSQPKKELAEVRPELEHLALAAQQPTIRQIGFVALINVDGSIDKAWKLALQSPGALHDLVDAVPLIADGSVRASFYPKIEPLLKGLPKELEASLPPDKTVLGRYVRIELPGRQRTLTLAEVEVFSGQRNIARQGEASQKNTAHGGEAARAIDGNKSGNFGDSGQTHTQEGTEDPWWQLDLEREVPIESIVIYNRTDGNLGKRLNGFTLKVLDRHNNVVFEKQKIPAPDVSASFEVGHEAPQVVIRHAAMNALTSVRGLEEKTFQTLAAFVKDDGDRSAALQALQRLPRAAWPKEQAQPLLDVLLNHIRKIPARERTSAAALAELEFADSLTTLLPAAQAKKVRAELGELGVRVIRVGTVPERMAFDQEVIAVQAGKPVEFVLENFDLMPHNFVITQPGALEEIGLAAEATGNQPDAARRHFVPPSTKILLSSILLQPRDVQKLSFIAPAQPGVYPIVCTYPGHWRRMYGALYVVTDLDGYRADPDKYLAGNPLPIRDALLKDHRPRTEWKVEDLAGAVEEMKNGRNHGNARQLFQAASCIACHKMDGMGNEFGPDLTKLDAKTTALDILKDIVEPSAKINEKYQTFIFTLKDGKTATGLILEETADVVKIIENPLAKAEPRLLKKGDIDSREKSPTSLMPKGLLDKLTREEILDLVAYIAARGNKEHPLFQREAHHH